MSPPLSVRGLHPNPIGQLSGKCLTAEKRRLRDRCRPLYIFRLVSSARSGSGPDHLLSREGFMSISRTPVVRLVGLLAAVALAMAATLSLASPASADTGVRARCQTNSYVSHNNDWDFFWGHKIRANAAACVNTRCTREGLLRLASVDQDASPELPKPLADSYGRVGLDRTQAIRLKREAGCGWKGLPGELSVQLEVVRRAVSDLGPPNDLFHRWHPDLLDRPCLRRLQGLVACHRGQS